MYVSVVYFDAITKAYCGRQYTYKTALPLKTFQKVLAPVLDKGRTVLKKALVTEVDLPESAISPEWADKVKEIKELDLG